MSQTTGLSDCAPRRPGAGRAARVGLAPLRRALGWPGRVLRARRMMMELGRLGEHELRDIGLTPLDLAAASALPLDADPSALLRRRAEGMRRRR